MEGFEFLPEIGGMAGVGDGVEHDADGTGGEFRAGLKSLGSGEQNGTLEDRLDGGAVFTMLGEGEAGIAGGDFGEGDGAVLAQAGDVIEGDDAVVMGVEQELVFGLRELGAGCVDRVDEGAEDVCGGGFAGALRTLQQEDGIGSGGTEGGDEPVENAREIGGRQVQESGGGAGDPGRRAREWGRDESRGGPGRGRDSRW